MVWLFPKTPPSKNSDREKAIYHVKKVSTCNFVALYRYS